MAHDLVGVPLGVHLDHADHLDPEDLRAHLVNDHGVDPDRIEHCQNLAARHHLAHVRDEYDHLLEAS